MASYVSSAKYFASGVGAENNELGWHARGPLGCRVSDAGPSQLFARALRAGVRKPRFRADGRDVPLPDSRTAARRAQLHGYSIISSAQSKARYVEAERLRHDQVNDEAELGRLLDRKIGGLRPQQNLVD